MARPEHFNDYADIPEIVPGVFVDPGDAVYIVDEYGEVVSWNLDEWAEDSEAATATINAVILAARKGASAVRKNIEAKGQTLRDLILETSYLIDEN